MTTVATTQPAVRPLAWHPSRPTWGPTLAVAVAVVFGVTLRAWRLGSQSLWFDEGYTAWVVSLPPAKVVEAIRVDTAPPLYYLLLRQWVAVAGRSEVAMRLPSAVCAVAALGVMAAVVRRLFRDRWARAAAVALVACSSMQVAYAHEVRFYALMSLVGAIDLYVAIVACERERTAIGWLAVAAVAWAVSLWLNNIMAVYLGCLGVAWLVLPGDRRVGRRLLDVAGVAVLAGLAFSPWVPALAAQARAIGANFWCQPPTGSDLIDMVERVAGVNEAGEAVGGVAVLALAGAAVATAAGVGRQRRLAAALAAFGLLPLLVTFVYSRHRTSIFMDRAFIVSSLVAPLLAAVPLEATVGRPERLRGAAAAVAALLVAVSARSAIADRHRVASHVEDWRGASRYAAAGPSIHRLTVFNANEGELLYDYYARGGDYSPSPDLTGTPADYFAPRPARTLQRVRSEAGVDGLRRLLASRPADDVVFVAAHGPYADADGRTLALLRGRMREADRRLFDAVTVYRFVPRAR